MSTYFSIYRSERCVMAVIILLLLLRLSNLFCLSRLAREKTVYEKEEQKNKTKRTSERRRGVGRSSGAKVSGRSLGFFLFFLLVGNPWAVRLFLQIPADRSPVTLSNIFFFIIISTPLASSHVYSGR